MGIYLLHQPVVLKATSFVMSLAFDNTRFPYFVFVVLGTFVCSLGVTHLLIKVPHSYYLFGEKPDSAPTRSIDR
jgi:hypothetical protein